MRGEIREREWGYLGVILRNKCGVICSEMGLLSHKWEFTARISTRRTTRHRVSQRLLGTEESGREDEDWRGSERACDSGYGARRLLDLPAWRCAAVLGVHGSGVQWGHWRIYHVDPLVCPKCGRTMKIIACIEAGQDEVIRKILEHCGLWRGPLPRALPRATSSATSKPVHTLSAVRMLPASACANLVEMDPDYIERLRRENQADHLEVPWE